MSGALAEALEIRAAVAPEDQARCFALRQAVFVEEQGVPVDEEMDGRDDAAEHVLAVAGAATVAAARLRRLGDTAKIERVCVARSCRGGGHGAALMRWILARLAAEPALARARLGSQLDAVGFYRRLGFAPVGETYLDAGIPHLDMTLELKPVRGCSAP